MADNNLTVADLAYAKMHLEFDRDRFVYEYDRYILPRSKHIHNGPDNVIGAAALNKAWQMVDPDVYSQQAFVPGECYLQRQTLRHGYKTWRQCTLSQLILSPDDDDFLKEVGYMGLVAARNMAWHRQWTIKPEFEAMNLSIIEYIKNSLPLQRLTMINAVSLETDQWASIHRDAIRTYGHGENPIKYNSLARSGLVVIVLNISDGEVPLYWSLDGDDQPPRFINDQVYMHSDYFLHGVPQVKSRRRQIRVTGVPRSDFFDFVDLSSSFILPKNYQYQLYDWEHSMR